MPAASAAAQQESELAARTTIAKLAALVLLHNHAAFVQLSDGRRQFGYRKP